MVLWGLGQVATMGQAAEELKQELEATAEEVLGRLKSHQLFQSDWDIAAFVVFLTFVGECGSDRRLYPGVGAGPHLDACLSGPQALWYCCCYWLFFTAVAVAAPPPPDPGR